MDNLILATDSYKLGHWNQYPKDTEGVYSYFENRSGGKYPYTVFFGLQYLLQKYFVGSVVTYSDLDEAANLARAHFGSELFNYRGWEHIISDHGGKLPLRIKAVKEGSVIPESNVLMTVENTCPKCFWLTNAVESILTHVWYSSTVATQSYTVKQMMKGYLNRTAESTAGVDFMLHDFGYRGVSSHESAAIGGAGHLLNFKGTDTLPAMLLAISHYAADLGTLGFSVAATEHSVMTAKGEVREFEVVNQLIKDHPTGILSCVADSYNVYNFVKKIGTFFKQAILERDGVFVVRPDSVTKDHQTPEHLSLWIVDRLGQDFGFETNDRDYKVLNPKVRVLWGDGIDPEGIERILQTLKANNWSAENMVFGMGGGLLQKVNRDTQRFAFKCSARYANKEWHDVYKDPLDSTKKSKRGRLALFKSPTIGYRTVDERLLTGADVDELELVFEDGELKRFQAFDDIRALTE